MARGGQPAFVADAIVETLRRLTRVQLYTYRSARAADGLALAGSIRRARPRSLHGAVCWSSAHDIEGSFRTLVSQPGDVHILAVRDRVKYRARFAEVATDYGASPSFRPIAPVVPIWIPDEFDATDGAHRQAVTARIQTEIATLIVDRVLGGLDSDDIEYFLSATGRIGAQAEVLYIVATRGFRSMSALSADVGLSSSAVRARLVLLHAARLLDRPTKAFVFYVSERGRALLEIMRRLQAEYARWDGVTPEFALILRAVGLEPRFSDPDQVRWRIPTFQRMIDLLEYTQWMFNIYDLEYPVEAVYGSSAPIQPATIVWDGPKPPPIPYG